MSHSIQRIAAAFLLAFLLLALALGRWSIAAPDLTERDDNPRRIFFEQLIQRGAIVDRNDRVLAETVPLSGTLVRRYPLPDAAPVTGYSSINYGQAGVEEALNDVLRGPADWFDRVLHRPQVGRSVRTTIDAAAQRILAAHMTQPGAAVVLSIPDGAVLALDSYPSFDPNSLDQNWKTLSTDPDAPLLNRATQGLYQPGAILQTVLLADALDHGQAVLTTTLAHADRPVPIDNLIFTCAHKADQTQTLAEAYAQACPAPFADLGVQLGATQLLSLTQHWKLDAPPPLEIRTSAAPTLTAVLSTAQALQAFAIGQGQLTVSPLQMGLVAATIGNGGFMPAPFVVKDVNSTDGQWMAYSTSARRPPEPIVAPETARAVLGAMHVDGHTTGHGGAAVSGNRQHSWFIGLAPIEQPRYAIAVLLETPQGDATTAAEKIGRAALEELLNTP